jgi:hypothetical protein
MRPRKNKIYGVAINDYDKEIMIDGKVIKSYSVWSSMLNRCYSEYTQNRNTTYIGCTVCDEWLSFSKFKEWFDSNYPYNIEQQGVKLELDKDLITDNCKMYSPDNCIFLPKKVNIFIANGRRNNVSGYTGVYWDKINNRWKSQISEFDSSKNKNIGRFKNIEDARGAYNKAREIECIKVKEYLRGLGYDEEIINKIK